MICPRMLAVLAGSLALAVPAQAQLAGHFHWEPGTTLTYRVEHVTTVLDETEGTKSKATTKLNESKHGKCSKWTGPASARCNCR